MGRVLARAQDPEMDRVDAKLRNVRARLILAEPGTFERKALLAHVDALLDTRIVLTRKHRERSVTS